MDEPRDLGVLFSELGGLVAFSPAVVRRELNPVEGEDLWSRLAVDDAGDRATDSGVIIPVTLGESDYCRVRVLVGEAAHPGASWPVRIDDRCLTVRAMATLLSWRSDDEREVRAEVPDGWYSVTAHLGVASTDDPDDAGVVLSLALRPVAARPHRTATLDARLDPSDQEHPPLDPARVSGGNPRPDEL